MRQRSDLISKGTTPTTLGRAFVHHGINFIKIEAITEDGQVDLEKLAHIDRQTHELLKRSQLKSGDILFSIAGALGRTAVVENQLLPANTNQAVAFIRLKQDSGVHRQFLVHYLRSDRIRGRVQAINVQAAQANLSLEDVRGFEVWLPPVPEQCAIATALGDVDRLIDSLDRLIAKKRDIKQAVMQQLLTGRQRLPQFRQVTPDAKSVGEGSVPSDWQLLGLGTLLTFKNGLNKGKQYFGHGMPIVNYMDVYGHSGLLTSNLRGRVDVNKHELTAYSVKKLGRQM